MFDKHPGSSRTLIIDKVKNNAIPTENDIIEICKDIDKENSTHLSSEGPLAKGYEHKGIIKMAKGIVKIDNWLERIEKGDSSLVDEISRIIPTKSNFSFASKFCHYVGQYAFDNPNLFSIFDAVIAKATPFYCWNYCHQKISFRLIKSLQGNCKKKSNYSAYQTLIDEIVKAAGITRQAYDRIVWYYFKGDKELIEYINRVCVEEAKIN